MNGVNTWRGRLRAALRWWQQGMLLLPEPLRRRGAGATWCLIEFGGEQLRLRILGADGRTIIDQLRIPATAEPALREQVREQARKFCQNGARLRLLLPATRVVRKRLRLPQAAEQNIRGALGFEMDRQTPFRQEQVYYDHRLLSRDGPGNTLEIELVAVQRAELDALLARLGSWNLHPSAVDLGREEDGLPCSYNLLPEELRNTPVRSSRNNLGGMLAILLALLLLATLYAPPLRQAVQLQRLEQALTQSRLQAAELANWQQQRNALQLRARFLAEQREAQPRAIELLHELTWRLQDDSWLERMTIQKGMLQLRGQAANPSALIRVIESSRYFSQARFRSPVTRDALTGKDRFHISVQLAETLPEEAL